MPPAYGENGIIPFQKEFMTLCTQTDSMNVDTVQEKKEEEPAGKADILTQQNGFRLTIADNV